MQNRNCLNLAHLSLTQFDGPHSCPQIVTTRRRLQTMISLTPRRAGTCLRPLVGILALLGPVSALRDQSVPITARLASPEELEIDDDSYTAPAYGREIRWLHSGDDVSSSSTSTYSYNFGDDDECGLGSVCSTCLTTFNNATLFGECANSTVTACPDMAEVHCCAAATLGTECTSSATFQTHLYRFVDDSMNGIGCPEIVDFLDFSTCLDVDTANDDSSGSVNGTVSSDDFSETRNSTIDGNSAAELCFDIDDGLCLDCIKEFVGTATSNFNSECFEYEDSSLPLCDYYARSYCCQAEKTGSACGSSTSFLAYLDQVINEDIMDVADCPNIDFSECLNGDSSLRTISGAHYSGNAPNRFFAFAATLACLAIATLTFLQ
ncbi:unnamed protein product [Choristocarpus tenellus]